MRVYEVWLARRFKHGGIKFGLIDLNSEFDVQEAGGLFLNSSAGIAAEILAHRAERPVDLPDDFAGDDRLCRPGARLGPANRRL